MRLYYMTAQRWAFTILSERRLKLSTFDEMNDPFELLGASIGEKDMRRIARFLHRHWKKTLGVICLSEWWGNPLMWAHYADKHSGLCLGFDVPDDHAMKVHYTSSRLKNLLSREKRLMGVDEDMLKTFLLTKFKDWSYERERRLFSRLEERDQETGHFYVDFGTELVLREVIIGARSKLTPAAVAKEVGIVNRPVTIFKARPAFNSFEIVRQREVKPHIVKACPVRS